MWYPDNVPRANRLQQLVDSIGDMQTDVIEMGKQMDDKDKDIRPVIDQLLKDRNLATIDDLIEKAKAQMTPEEKNKFEALINAAKKAGAPFDWMSFIAGIILLPKGDILDGKGLIAAGRFVFRARFIRQVASFFEVAQSTKKVAEVAEAVEELSNAASEVAKELGEVGDVGEAGAEIAAAASMMSKIGSFCKVLGELGFVTTIIASILQAMQEKEQKDKLIEDIQKLQPSRLSTAFFKSEATNISQQLELIVGYVKVMKESPIAAKTLSDQIVHNITAANSKIDLTTLEEECETRDRADPNYYGGADLSTAEVVKLAESDK